jgi:hypothetical protein
MTMSLCMAECTTVRLYPPPMFSVGTMALSWTFVLVVTVLLGWLRRRATRKLPFPPGPPGLPLLKNLFDVPMKLEYLAYQKMGEMFGDVTYFNVLGNHFLVLNSVKAAVDLLEQRSNIYSDRPYIPMLHEKDL